MSRFLDLSHEVVAGMTTYPGLPAPVIDDFLGWEESHSRYGAGTEFQIGQITMVANTGTYLDVPAHRYRDGTDLTGVPLQSVADLPGVVIRTERVDIGPDAFAGSDVSGRAVLVCTGWDRHWRTERYGALEHPHLTDEAAGWLVEHRAALVGIDSVNIDGTHTPYRPAHSRLLAADIPIVEHLCRLDELPDRDFRFFAVPAKVAGLGAFPVRAFALLAD